MSGEGARLPMSAPRAEYHAPFPLIGLGPKISRKIDLAPDKRNGIVTRKISGQADQKWRG